MTQDKEFLATFFKKDNPSKRWKLGVIAEDAQNAWEKAQRLKRQDEELVSVTTGKFR